MSIQLTLCALVAAAAPALDFELGPGLRSFSDRSLDAFYGLNAGIPHFFGGGPSLAMALAFRPLPFLAVGVEGEWTRLSEGPGARAPDRRGDGNFVFTAHRYAAFVRGVVGGEFRVNGWLQASAGAGAVDLEEWNPTQVSDGSGRAGSIDGYHFAISALVLGAKAGVDVRVLEQLRLGLHVGAEVWRPTGVCALTVSDSEPWPRGCGTHGLTARADVGYGLGLALRYTLPLALGW